MIKINQIIEQDPATNGRSGRPFELQCYDSDDHLIYIKYCCQMGIGEVSRCSVPRSKMRPFSGHEWEYLLTWEDWPVAPVPAKDAFRHIRNITKELLDFS